MNGYETVYTPSTPKVHECRPARRLDYLNEIKYADGTIVCCDVCGQHWFADMVKEASLYVTKWYKVRWYHFVMKKRILGID